MTAITQNLPWFVKDLGVSIVGQDCYTSIVENLDFTDRQCLKYSLSKGLGLGIVVGGSIMKVPQLLLVVSARSARGLSLTAYVLETLAYAITTAYAYRNSFPFSTYGENLFLTIQNVVITALIVHYNPPNALSNRSALQRAILSTQIAIASVIPLVLFPMSTIALFQIATLPLSLFSKLPQIRQNYRAQSTGQLSAFAVISQVGGCLARLFTTAQEVGDPIVAAGFALALVLNVVLGFQMWLYWGKDEKDELEMGPIGVPEKPRTHWTPPPQKVEVVRLSQHYVQVDTGSPNLWLGSTSCSSSACSPVGGEHYDSSASQPTGQSTVRNALTRPLDYIPCTTPLNISFTLDTRSEVFLHPLDLTTYPPNDASSETCAGLIQTPTSLPGLNFGSTADMVLGVTFLRNAYFVMADDPPSSNGSFPTNSVHSDSLDAVRPHLGLLNITNPGLSAGVLIGLLGFVGLCAALFAGRWAYMRRKYKRERAASEPFNGDLKVSAYVLSVLGYKARPGEPTEDELRQRRLEAYKRRDMSSQYTDDSVVTRVKDSPYDKGGPADEFGALKLPANSGAPHGDYFDP
uniref:Mannose-P-dolichol utilization defect 1 protein homolog n=1 Tax=Ganoderma boninense TaxID=34458 RepID=A0A5K1JXS7_9APHY|nr:Uncharacterized protein [Ganoderma boninense]